MSSREFIGFTVSEWLGMLAAAGSAALLFWKRIGSQCVTGLINAFSAPKRINELMELVRHELSSNSGESLKDHVMKSSSVLAGLRSEFEATTRTVAGLRVSAQILLSEMSVPIWESDEHGNTVWINDRFTQVTGWVLAEIKGQNWRANCIHQDDLPIVERAWDNAIAGRRPFRCTYRWKTKDGRTLLIEARSRTIDTDNGKVIGYFGMVRVLES